MTVARRTACASLLLAATPATGHVGFAANDLYAGLFHPLLHLSTLLPLLAAVLWLSLGRPLGLSTRITVLLVGVLVGALLAFNTGLQLPSAPALLLMAIGLGALAALDRHLPTAISILLLGLLGVLEGYDNIGPDRGTIGDPLLYSAGLLLATGLVPLHSVPMLLGRKALWLRTGIRVLGSWIAAASLLVLALSQLS